MSRHPGITHDGTERALRENLRRSLEYSDVENGSWSVLTEETHREGELPSGKSYCRVDVELDLLGQSFAFEVKMSRSDCLNWFTQRRDYEHLGLTPVLVTQLSVAYDLIPHSGETLTDSYIILDERENEWYWPSMPADVFRSQFSNDEPATLVDYCPVCGCWTKGRIPVVRCANCDWSDYDA